MVILGEWVFLMSEVPLYRRNIGWPKTKFVSRWYRRRGRGRGRWPAHLGLLVPGFGYLISNFGYLICNFGYLISNSGYLISGTGKEVGPDLFHFGFPGIGTWKVPDLVKSRPGFDD